MSYVRVSRLSERRSIIAAASAALALALPACGGGGAAVTAPEPPGEPAAVASLAIIPANPTVAPGATVRLGVEAVDASGRPLSGLPNPTWSTSDSRTATVDAAGVVTGVAPGSATITATLNDRGATRVAATSLTVTTTTPPQAGLATLSVDPATLTLPVGGSGVVTATARDENGNVMTGVGAPSFASANGAVASVDAAGGVRGLSPGSATVTATLTSGAVTRSATATIIVLAPPPPPPPASAVVVAANRTYTPATVTIAPNGQVTWQMDDDRHTVTFSGPKPTGGDIPETRNSSVDRTFPAPGTYPYRCLKHEGMGGTVVVEAQQAPVLAGLRVDPSSASIAVGGTAQLTATPIDQAGNPIAGPAATWSSANPSIATVSGGVVSGVAVGTVVVSASVSVNGVSKTATATITVSGGAPPPPPPAPPSGATVTTVNTSFSPASVTIAPGAAVTWTITGATHNVTFTGAKPTGGDIGDTRDSSASRAFPVAGTYPYLCTRHSGMTGTVVVR